MGGGARRLAATIAVIIGARGEHATMAECRNRSIADTRRPVPSPKNVEGLVRRPPSIEDAETVERR